MTPPMDLWLLLRIALGLIAMVLLASGHVQMTKSHIRAGLWEFQGLTEKKDHMDLQRRFDEELLQTRIQTIKKVSAGLFHFVVFFVAFSTWNFLNQPSLSSLFLSLSGWTCYLMVGISPELVKTEHQFHRFQQFAWFLHVALIIGTASEKDLMMFDVAERLCTFGVISTSMTLIDVKVMLPFHLFQSALLTYCRWSLIGFDKMTPYIAWASIMPNIVVAGVIPLAVHNIRSNLAAKLDSGDASSLMLGFRQILRGVCDGDFILDRSTMTIIDDANCLARVLKSNRKYTNSNFLDLFLDAESREQFSQFVAAEDPTESSTMPRGLRVSLQGAGGAVSMDVFYTALPRPGASSDYCLLAMKEDPEASSIPPEAPPDSVPPIQPVATSHARTRSSVSEIVVAYDDLVEIALLVSDVTGFLDVEEVHLSFQRRSDVSNIESGMPTLRKFIRPSEWDRIEQMFNIVLDLPPSEQQRRCYFARPTLFRVPGESRSYLCARSTSLSLADQSIVPGRPTHFWMHLSQFDSSQIARPREQELEGIAEE